MIEKIVDYISLASKAYEMTKTFARRIGPLSYITSFAELSPRFPKASDPAVKIVYLDDEGKRWGVSTWADRYKLNDDGSIKESTRIYFDCVVRPNCITGDWPLDLLVMDNEYTGRKVLFDKSEIKQKGDKETNDKTTDQIFLASKAYKMVQTIVRLHLYKPALVQFPKASDPGVNIVYLGNEDYFGNKNRGWGVSAWAYTYESKPDGTVGDRVKVPFSCIVRLDNTSGRWYMTRDEIIMNTHKRIIFYMFHNPS